MSENSSQEVDGFKQKLEEQLKILQECQESQNVDSCLKCDKILECSIRQEYVKAVYLSMNKGDTGGFEF